MTGYHPDHSFLTKMGVQIDEETGRPIYTEDRMETNAENIFMRKTKDGDILDMSREKKRGVPVNSKALA